MPRKAKNGHEVKLTWMPKTGKMSMMILPGNQGFLHYSLGQEWPRAARIDRPPCLENLLLNRHHAVGLGVNSRRQERHQHYI